MRPSKIYFKGLEAGMLGELGDSSNPVASPWGEPEQGRGGGDDMKQSLPSLPIK